MRARNFLSHSCFYTDGKTKCWRRETQARSLVLQRVFPSSSTVQTPRWFASFGQPCTLVQVGYCTALRNTFHTIASRWQSMIFRKKYHLDQRPVWEFLCKTLFPLPSGPNDSPASVFLSSDSPKNVSFFPRTRPSALPGPRPFTPPTPLLHVPLSLPPSPPQGLCEHILVSFLPHLLNSREWVSMTSLLPSPIFFLQQVGPVL